MKKFYANIAFLIIFQNICFSQSWQVIFDTTIFGISDFKSFTINNQPRKLIFFRQGLNYNPNINQSNESGRYIRFIQNTYSYYVPFNNFLNASWVWVNNPPLPPSLHCYPVIDFKISPTDTGTLFKNAIIAYFDPDEYNRMTTNGGLNYFSVPDNIAYSSGNAYSGFDFNPAAPGEAYIGYIWFDTQYRKGIFKNLYSYQYWEVIDTIPELKAVTAGGFLRVNPFNTQNLFVVGNKMLLSTQGGYSFYELDVPQFKTMLFDDTDSTIFGFTAGKLYTSFKNGIIWDSIPINFNPNCTEISLDNHNILYAGSDTGLFRSTNRGTNWQLYNNSFSYSKKVIGISKERFTGDTVIVCTDKALYKVWASEIVSGIKKTTNTIPYEFSLSQNYPNPFNPISKIKFQISKLSKVKLLVFDVLGREIATLVNDQLQSGTYETEWDASNYPSGVYFYKLIAADYSETRKMILIK